MCVYVCVLVLSSKININRKIGRNKLKFQKSLEKLDNYFGKRAKIINNE